MQKLMSLNADGRPLDHGLNLDTAARGIRMVGRPENAGYHGQWFDGLTSSDVTLTDVADNYEIPAPPAPPTPEQVAAGFAQGQAERRALVLARAKNLDKKGKYLEASAMRATIGE